MFTKDLTYLLFQFEFYSASLGTSNNFTILVCHVVYFLSVIGVFYCTDNLPLELKYSEP